MPGNGDPSLRRGCGAASGRCNGNIGDLLTGDSVVGIVAEGSGVTIGVGGEHGIVGGLHTPGEGGEGEMCEIVDG